MLTPEQQQFVKEVRDLCTRNYDKGGDTIIECYTDEEIVSEFKTLDEVKKFCGLKVEQALNCRWGEDSDPEVARAERFKQWED